VRKQTLLSFSLLPTLGDGSTIAIVGAATALAAWGVVGFALVPLLDYSAKWDDDAATMTLADPMRSAISASGCPVG
jgi:hypothetical protein